MCRRRASKGLIYQSSELTLSSIDYRRLKLTLCTCYSYYESALLQSLDFFLDLGADSTFPSDVDVQYSYRRAPTSQSQFIHRSGTLLVAILGGEDGFAYMPNRIFTSHAQGLKPDEAMSELVRICSDEKRLEELWKQLQSEVEVKVPTEEEQ